MFWVGMIWAVIAASCVGLYTDSTFLDLAVYFSLLSIYALTRAAIEDAK